MTGKTDTSPPAAKPDLPGRERWPLLCAQPISIEEFKSARPASSALRLVEDFKDRHRSAQPQDSVADQLGAIVAHNRPWVCRACRSANQPHAQLGCPRSRYLRFNRVLTSVVLDIRAPPANVAPRRRADRRRLQATTGS